MEYKNQQMEQMMENLRPILQQRNKIGYVAARNYRLMRETLTEYFDFKNDLIKKYGKQEIDKNGQPTQNMYIDPKSPEFEKFKMEFSSFSDIKHNVELMTLTYDEVIGFLNGEEILKLEWMLHD